MRSPFVLMLAFPPALAAQLPRSQQETRVVVETPPSNRSAIPVPAADPAGFSATVQPGGVLLSWQPVPGVPGYLLAGPGLGLNGQQIRGTRYQVNGLGAGTYEWTVASLAGEGQGPVNNWTRWPRARASVEVSKAGTGRYRITILGFRADRETADDLTGRDGERDEVYTAAYVRVMDRRTQGLLLEGVVQSDTYGDVGGSFPGRRRGGSVQPHGGIRSGDRVPDGLDPRKPSLLPGENTLPLLLWDGSLTEGGEVVLVTPTLWEWDGGNEALTAWREARRQETSRILSDDRIQRAIGAPGFAPAVLEPPRVTGTASGLARYTDGGRDRPIGLHRVADRQEPPLDLPNQVIAITREKIELELATQQRSGTGMPGTIALEFDDDPAADHLAGKYTLYLRAERIQ